jgi:hypothetical protein
MADLQDGISQAQRDFWAWVETNTILRNYPGVAERDVLKLAKYGRSGRPGSGGRALIKFVLSVWNAHKWPGGRFDVIDHGALDQDQQAWVAAWFASPRWP